jgi:2-keto-4-pentenoate hydratase/2-oxohepta-3-ene-1,7-dioic acid hydratase in catechol pathway
LKLLRYGKFGVEKPGLLDSKGQIRDLSAVINDISGDNLLPEKLAFLKQLDITQLPLVPSDIRLGACIKSPGKFICIGLNYYDHAAEVGLDIPKEPLIFNKATSSICGPNDNIPIPKNADRMDWEVELGIVIGSPAKYVSVQDAYSHIAGYCVVNDLTERRYQFERGGQWTKGKSGDYFGPIGPWLVTPDEIENPQELDLWLTVDGVMRQKSNTAKMIFPVAEVVSYLSQLFTLHPGDIIATGTPAGVGVGVKPNPIFLKAGETIELGISGLGRQCQTLITENHSMV